MGWPVHVLDPVTGSRVSLAAFRRFTDAIPRLLWLRISIHVPDIWATLATTPNPPRCEFFDGTERGRKMVMAYLVGMATAEIGPLFDVTRQRVHQILHKELYRQCESAGRWMVRPA
jgi:hypothetical protein